MSQGAHLETRSAERVQRSRIFWLHVRDSRRSGAYSAARCSVMQLTNMPLALATPRLPMGRQVRTVSGAVADVLDHLCAAANNRDVRLLVPAVVRTTNLWRMQNASICPLW